MQTQSRTSGNGGNGRGMQGRPEIVAREKFGEERVAEILEQKKATITALFANDPRPDAMFERACALAVAAYRKIQDDENESAARQNKSPKRIDEASAVACCLWAMQRKLDPGTDVYLVPYGGKVTPIISPEGVIKLLFRTGLVKAVNARYVFNGEIFDYELGSTQWVKHKKNNVRPPAAKDDRGQVVENIPEWNLLSYAYAIIDLKDGGQIIEVLDKADIEYFRSLSPTGKSPYGGWAKFPAAFGRKAALKQAGKFAPKDSEVSIILTSDDTEQGIAIPDDIWKSIGAKMVKEMTGERGSSPGEEPPPATKGSAQSTVAKSKYAGDPKRVTIPGGQNKPPVAIAEASEQQLTYWENRLRTDMLAGKWTDQYHASNQEKLATVRDELIRRGHGVEPLPQLDGTSGPEHVDNVPEFVGREPGMEG